MTVAARRIWSLLILCAFAIICVGMILVAGYCIGFVGGALFDMIALGWTNARDSMNR
jgi:hypothetical protein